MSEMECSSDDKSSTGSLWPKTPDAESRKLLYWCEITVTIIPSFNYIMVELRHVKFRWWYINRKMQLFVMLVQLLQWLKYLFVDVSLS